MGDFAAHLNQWLDQDQPTLFELVAQRDLGQTLRPALEHFLKVSIIQPVMSGSAPLQILEFCYHRFTV